MTDRYARLNHGYMDERDCSDYAITDKPEACLDGSADALSAVALEQMVYNLLVFFTSPLCGSISDEYGRKGEFKATYCSGFLSRDSISVTTSD